MARAAVETPAASVALRPSLQLPPLPSLQPFRAPSHSGSATDDSAEQTAGPQDEYGKAPSPSSPDDAASRVESCPPPPGSYRSPCRFPTDVPQSTATSQNTLHHP